MRISYILIILILIGYSCNQYPDSKDRGRISSNEIIDTKGCIVPQDRLSEPIIIEAGKPKIIKAGKPKISYTNTKTYPAGAPDIVIPTIYEEDTTKNNKLSEPIKLFAVETTVLAGKPQTVEAKEGHIIENYHKNFSNFGKLQGLTANSINTIIQDNIGNLWLGTAGGLSRYDGHSFTHYTKKEGLLKNRVLSVLFDKNKQLWIGTYGGGISKFDGKYFTHFSTNEKVESNIINDILEDSKGNIWFATPEGVLKYDGKYFTVFTQNNGLISNEVYEIFEDNEGKIWIGTFSGVSVYDGSNFSNFSFGNDENYDEIRAIIQDKEGNYWFGTESGAIKYDGVNYNHYGSKQGLSDNSIFSIFESDAGNLWFGTWGTGACVYDGKTFIKYYDNTSMVNNEVKCIFQDRHGILWFGTRAGGLNRYFGNIFDHYIFGEGNPNTQVQNILLDKNNNIWFGTWGKGVYKYNEKSFTQYTSKEGLYNNDVRTIAEDRNGNIWFGSWGGVTKFDGNYFTQYTEKEGLINRMVISSMLDASGNLWFGTEGSGVSKFDGKHFTHYNIEQGLSGNIIYAMLQDRDNRIWFCTNNGITRFITSDSTSIPGVFTHFTEKNGLPSNKIISALEDKSGNIWFGSAREGLIMYNGQYFTLFTEENGLCDNGIMSILEDMRGNLWIGSRTGINKLYVDPLKFAVENQDQNNIWESIFFMHYRYDNGFSGIGCNANAICEDKNGGIWVGANDRISVILTGEDNVDTTAPKVQLTEVYLFNEEIPWIELERSMDSKIVLENGMVLRNIIFDSLTYWYNIPVNLSLAYDNNFITFHFSGITTQSAQNVEYIYKLDGLEDKWKNITKQTSVSYAHLPHGKYTFRVKATNNKRIWSNESVYKFNIRAPWWLTNWAYFFYIVLFVALIYLIDRIQTRRVVSKERDKTKDRDLRQAKLIKEAYNKLRQQNEIVKEQKVELEKEKKHSDDLLLNILPAEVANELKVKGFSDAEHIEGVSVLFTDFVDFTKLSELLSPQEIVSEIHECFSHFDHIVKRHNVEKIKTIGDSYMAAGGLPVNYKDSAKNTIKAALEMQQFIINRNLERDKHKLPAFEMRVGIHTGPIVAGIVGILKFQYDIWGDTVNTASRMETAGVIEKVNVSDMTYQILKDDPDLVFKYRGKIEAKNKGVLDMYFVDYN